MPTRRRWKSCLNTAEAVDNVILPTKRLTTTATSLNTAEAVDNVIIQVCQALSLLHSLNTAEAVDNVITKRKKIKTCLLLSQYRRSSRQCNHCHGDVCIKTEKSLNTAEAVDNVILCGQIRSKPGDVSIPPKQ